MQTKKSEIIIVIPCYNEAGRLPRQAVMSYLSNSNGKVRLLLVNDGSTDTTGTLVDEMAAESPYIGVLHLKCNSGKAEAVRQGILAALEEKADYVGYWDADLATPLSEIDNFLRYLENPRFRVVTGCRLARMGAGVRRKTSRHYLGRVFATIVSNLLRIQVYDTQCGAKIFAADIAAAVFQQPFITSWLFDVEILRRMKHLFGREQVASFVYEYPLMEWRDVSGSKLKFSTMLKAPFWLIRIFLSR